MSDQPPKKPSLSEISHLFLSSVRDRHTNGANRPRRTPPNRSDLTIDLTPEEFAQVYGGSEAAPEPRRRAVPVSAIIGSHLNGKQFDRVKQYARHRASHIGRVGLIELDASEFRLMCFEAAAPGSDDAEPQTECAEPRQMIEALEEMNWDVDQWLLLLPNLRTPEAKAILRQVDHWILLSTCDHDGVVSGYRMLKSVAESMRPRLTLSVLDATDDAMSGRVYQKLSGVCQQFLNWPMDAEPPVQNADGVSEHLVLMYRPTRDKAQQAIAPQWDVVAEFLAASKAAKPTAAEASSHDDEAHDPRQLIDDLVIETESQAPAIEVPVAAPVASSVATLEIPAPILPTAVSPQPAAVENLIDDVIDLPDHDASAQSILVAVLQKSGGDLIECPLRPPMYGEARLAVERDRGIVLLVAANQGLGNLRSISHAYNWLTENRELIRMALPQFAIDPNRTPRLRLLVDRADVAADALSPLLSNQHVTIQAYRKLRWGQRLGVFLEAA